MINVCLILHASRSCNLGVGALTVAQVDLLREISRKIDEPIHIKLLDWHDSGALCVAGDDISIIRLSRKDFLNPYGLWRHFRRSDVVLDIGAGDSFADIYGPKRLRRMFILKFLAQLAQRPFVLSPQTFGAFTKHSSRLLAKLNIALSTLVFARDEASALHLQEIGVRRAIAVASDVALRMPAEDFTIKKKRPAVGLNVSGLLMSGGYTGGNQFGLECDYTAMVRQLIERFLTHPEQPEIHLIPHVISPDMPIEDDAAAARALQKDYPALILAPAFETPQQAKGYIAQMDFFTGARMHACIAAFSSGVAVVPMAYSRKFIGLFGALGYHEVADCRMHRTGKILQMVVDGFDDRATLSDQSVRASRLGRQRLANYEDALQELLLQVRAGKEKPAAKRAAGMVSST